MYFFRPRRSLRLLLVLMFPLAGFAAEADRSTGKASGTPNGTGEASGTPNGTGEASGTSDGTGKASGTPDGTGKASGTPDGTGRASGTPDNTGKARSTPNGTGRASGTPNNAGRARDTTGEFNPFGPTTAVRDDALPGCVEFSDDSRVAGHIYLTRDQRLVIYDEQLQRQREVPLETIRQIDCKVKREWMEKEYRFKETTTDEKVFSGQSYPVREYLHTITLRGGRTITGPISGIVFVEPSRQSTEGDAAREASPPLRVILHKRDKGQFGAELKSLVYAKSIKLGKEAMAQGSRKAPAAPKPNIEKPNTEEPSTDEPAPAK